MSQNNREASYFDTRVAAHYLGLSHHTLEIWRHKGEGPPFVKLGRAVRYRRDVLDQWALDNQRTHTGGISK